MNEQEFLEIEEIVENNKKLIKLSQFLFVEKLGLNGGTLSLQDALDFIKSTIYGRQPEIINLNILLPAEIELKDIENTPIDIYIPPVNYTLYKNNKFETRKRGLGLTVMSIPKTAKIQYTKGTLKSEIDTMKNKNIKGQLQEIYSNLANTVKDADVLPEDISEKISNLVKV